MEVTVGLITKSVMGSSELGSSSTAEVDGIADGSCSFVQIDFPFCIASERDGMTSCDSLSHTSITAIHKINY